MLISQVNGYNEGDRYHIEFRVGGSIYAVLDADPENTPSTGNTLNRFAGPDFENPIYEVVETGLKYKMIFLSGMTDLVLLEQIKEAL